MTRSGHRQVHEFSITPVRNAMLVSTFVVFLPVCVAALWHDSNHALWAAMALFMLARTVTLWVATRGALASPAGEPGVR